MKNQVDSDEEGTGKKEKSVKINIDEPPGKETGSLTSNEENKETNENKSQHGRCAFCLHDDSHTCRCLSIVTFAVITIAIICLVYYNSPVMEYFYPTPYVTPNKTFSVDYISQSGYRYDFYEKKETYEMARKICEYHNTTLLVFNSSLEEREFDCYLNVRNNAEDKQVIVWLNETILFGGPLMYARFSSFISENREDVLLMTNLTIAENGCDVQKDYGDRKAIWTADQENRRNETLYHIAKVYGNYGIRSSKQGSRNGCWNFIRYDKAVDLKHTVVCRSLAPVRKPTQSSSPALPGHSNKKLFSEEYCN